MSKSAFQKPAGTNGGPRNEFRSLSLALDAASGGAFFRRRHTCRARNREGLFEPDLCNIPSHRVAGEGRTNLGSDATVLVLRREQTPVVIVVEMNDFRHSRIRSSMKAEDYQPNLFTIVGLQRIALGYNAIAAALCTLQNVCPQASRRATLGGTVRCGWLGRSLHFRQTSRQRR